MSATIKYLDAAKKKLEISSDYALAKHLELTTQAVSKLRNGRAIMSNTTAARIAEILELDLRRVIAELELERGSNDELWKRIAKKVAAIAGVGAGFALVAHLAQRAGADPQQLVDASALFASTLANPVYYVKFPPGGAAVAIAATILIVAFLLSTRGAFHKHSSASQPAT